MAEHPSNAAWHQLKGLISPAMALLGERPPEAPLEEHLKARRQVASALVQVAHDVIDAIDQNPADG